MFNFHTTYSRADQYGNCVYCDKPLCNSPTTTRGDRPIHVACDAELNEELIVWERESGISDAETLDYYDSHERQNHPPNM